MRPTAGLACILYHFDGEGTSRVWTASSARPILAFVASFAPSLCMAWQTNRRTARGDGVEAVAPLPGGVFFSSALDDKHDDLGPNRPSNANTGPEMVRDVARCCLAASSICMSRLSASSCRAWHRRLTSLSHLYRDTRNTYGAQHEGLRSPGSITQRRHQRLVILASRTPSNHALSSHWLPEEMSSSHSERGK